jgi:hypothetical protein
MSGHGGERQVGQEQLVLLWDQLSKSWIHAMVPGDRKTPNASPGNLACHASSWGNFWVDWSKLSSEEREMSVKKHVAKLMEDEAALDTIQVIK